MTRAGGAGTRMPPAFGSVTRVRLWRCVMSAKGREQPFNHVRYRPIADI